LVPDGFAPVVEAEAVAVGCALDEGVCVVFAAVFVGFDLVLPALLPLAFAEWTGFAGDGAVVCGADWMIGRAGPGAFGAAAICACDAAPAAWPGDERPSTDPAAGATGAGGASA
jgi:hypothetical protein